MGWLDPPPLERIAEAIRDRELLDVRVVGEGVLPRVLPINVTVWQGHDDVAFTQEYIQDGDFQKAHYTFDAEDIMWLKPTICGISDVEPPTLPSTGAIPGDEEMVRHALEAVAFAENCKADDILNRTTPTLRYVVMLLLWETTGMSQPGIAAALGYRSPTPLFSAQGAVRSKPELKSRVKEMHGLLEQRVGRKLPYRRRTDLRQNSVL